MINVVMLAVCTPPSVVVLFSLLDLVTIFVLTPFCSCRSQIKSQKNVFGFHEFPLFCRSHEAGAMGGE